MGYMGPGLPGQRSAESPSDREFVEEQWGIPRGSLRTDVGDGHDRHVLAAWPTARSRRAGSSAPIPLPAWPIGKTVLAGLEAAELVIAQDAFIETETNEYADVFLPAALWAESDGVMVNSERNLTLFQQGRRAAGQALPDWQIIARIACAMGFSDSFSYDSAEEVFDEIKRSSGIRRPATTCAAPATSGCARRRCNGRCPPRAPRRPQPDPLPQRRRQPDPVRPRGRQRAAAGVPDPKRACGVLRAPAPAAGGDARRRLPVLAQHRPPAAPVAHDDQDRQGRQAQQAQPRAVRRDSSRRRRRLQICDDDRVEIASRRGRAVLPAVVTDRVRPGNCFAPFHWNDVFGEYLCDQRRHQRRRRSGIAATGIQVLRGHLDQCQRPRRGG